jgi:hypothetical protein
MGWKIRGHQCVRGMLWSASARTALILLFLHGSACNRGPYDPNGLGEEAALGSGHRDAGAADASPPDAGTPGARRHTLRPTLDCVREITPQSFVAFFGFENESTEVMDVPIGPGNEFRACQADLGQPTRFEPGCHHGVFSVRFSGSELTWALNGRTVKASEDSRRCASDDDVTFFAASVESEDRTCGQVCTPIASCDTPCFVCRDAADGGTDGGTRICERSDCDAEGARCSPSLPGPFAPCSQVCSSESSCTRPCAQCQNEENVTGCTNTTCEAFTGQRCRTPDPDEPPVSPGEGGRLCPCQKQPQLVGQFQSFRPEFSLLAPFIGLRFVPIVIDVVCDVPIRDADCLIDGNCLSQVRFVRRCEGTVRSWGERAACGPPGQDRAGCTSR